MVDHVPLAGALIAAHYSQSVDHVHIVLIWLLYTTWVEHVLLARDLTVDTIQYWLIMFPLLLLQLLYTIHDGLIMFPLFVL